MEGCGKDTPLCPLRGLETLRLVGNSPGQAFRTFKPDTRRITDLCPMSKIWQNLRQTAIAGTDRHPVSEADRMALGIPESADAAQTALRALAAATLLHRAARPLNAGPHGLPEACPPDDRPLAPSGAVPLLEVMLNADGFPQALPDFFEKMDRHGYRLPPECMPQLLDWAARKRQFPEAMQRSMGAPGRWLAMQHPDWQALFPQEKPDWETDAFQKRLQLLRETRQARPKTALAWLEKTWDQERAEHRAQFLQALRSGLSAADEALLDRALLDRSRPVRFMARRLLLLLPDSGLRQTVQRWLANLPVAESKATRLPSILEKHLPQEGPFSKMQLLALAGEKNNSDALAILLELLPPEDLAKSNGYTPADFLGNLLLETKLDESQGTSLLENIAWRANPDWLLATARFFLQNPDHALWNTAALAEIVNALPAVDWLASMAALAAHRRLLEAEHSALVCALLESELPWPDALVQALVYYPIRSDQPRHWTPPAHFKALLQRAAYGCSLSVGLALNMDDTNNWPFPWYGELVRFKKVVAFRQRLAQAFPD